MREEIGTKHAGAVPPLRSKQTTPSSIDPSPIFALYLRNHGPVSAQDQRSLVFVPRGTNPRAPSCPHRGKEKRKANTRQQEQSFLRSNGSAEVENRSQSSRPNQSFPPRGKLGRAPRLFGSAPISLSFCELDRAKKKPQKIPTGFPLLPTGRRGCPNSLQSLPSNTK